VTADVEVSCKLTRFAGKLLTWREVDRSCCVSGVYVARVCYVPGSGFHFVAQQRRILISHVGC
jgi:hypothetical protein